MTITLSAIQWWNTFWQVAGVALLALTFAAGFGSLLTSRWLNQEQEAKLGEQAARMVELNTKLEEQREKTANAEKSLLEFEMRSVSPRYLSSDSWEILKNGEKGAASILYLANNYEAWRLAQEFESTLQATGWNVAKPQPIGVDRVPAMGVKLEVGTALYDQNEQVEGQLLCLKEPAQTLWEFFLANLQLAGTGGFGVNDELEPHAVVIVIGAKTM